MARHHRRGDGRRTRAAALLAASLLATAASAAPAAGQVTPVHARGSILGTTLDWGVLGAPFDAVASPFTVATPGNAVTVTNATGGDMERRDQTPCEFWDGNFASCERLLWTSSSPGTGPLTFQFASPVLAFGTNIQADDPGPFTAFLTLYLGASPLGTVVRGGTWSSAGDGSALFIGAGSLTPFDRAELGLTDALVDPADFAINGPVFGSTVPEPASLALLGAGLVALGAARGAWRRRERSGHA